MAGRAPPDSLPDAHAQSRDITGRMHAAVRALTHDMRVIFGRSWQACDARSGGRGAAPAPDRSDCLEARALKGPTGTPLHIGSTGSQLKTTRLACTVRPRG
jgi:hypothetical protein